MQARLKRQMSLNLPQPVMDALVEEAERLDRSRSYVAERAIRAYLRLDDAKPAQQIQPSQPAQQIQPSQPWPRGAPATLPTWDTDEQTGYIPEGSSEERGVPPGDAPC